jgi:hypothetical protein
VESYRICRIRSSSTRSTRSSRPICSVNETSGRSGGSYCELTSLGVLRYVSRNGIRGPSFLGFHRPACPFALFPCRRREADDADQAGFGEELCHFAHAADVLFSLGARHAEIRADTRPDVIAVEDEHLNMTLEQLALERLGERRLTAAGNAGEPHDRAAMSVAKVALAASHL